MYNVDVIPVNPDYPVTHVLYATWSTACEVARDFSLYSDVLQATVTDSKFSKVLATFENGIADFD